MKLAISTAALILLFGTATASFARQEEGKSQEQHQQGAKPEHQEAKPEQQAKPAQQPHPQQKANTEQHVQTQNKPAEAQAKPAQQHAQAKPAQQQHAQQAAHPQQQQTHAANHQQSHPANGNNGNNAHGRISDAHYASNFGSGHHFRVSQGDYHSRRFQYGGYSFGFVDPWPVAWGYSDDVYVAYVDGGYYMYDVVHPGVRISINIM
jgi:hypothetical protein